MELALDQVVLLAARLLESYGEDGVGPRGLVVHGRAAHDSERAALLEQLYGRHGVGDADLGQADDPDRVVLFSDVERLAARSARWLQVEQVLDLLVVDFDEGDLDGEFGLLVFALLLVYPQKEIVEDSRDHADVVQVVYVDCVGGGLVAAESGRGRLERDVARAHGERFAAARLAVGQNGGVVAAEERVEERLDGRLVDLDLGRGVGEDVVVGEGLVLAEDDLGLAVDGAQALGAGVFALALVERPDADGYLDGYHFVCHFVCVFILAESEK